MAVKDSTQRFSSRVENYVRYRPGYPSAVLDLLKNECGLTTASVIADIASGTGIFTRMLLENGNRVFGVEPNADMRKAGEEFLRGYPQFTSVAGTAEATTLADHSVDLVTAAQAAHWFDREKARREFIRILPARRVDGVAVERAAHRIDAISARVRAVAASRTAPTIRMCAHERTTEQIETFFAPSPFQVAHF